MSILQINQDNTENFTLATNPPRTFISGSTTGVTGVLNIFPRRSNVEKEAYPLALFTGSYIEEFNLEGARSAIVQASQGTSNISSLLGAYLENVTSQPASLRKQQTVEIVRFTPPTIFVSDTSSSPSNTLKKTTVVNNLMPYYHGMYPEAHFSFTNYNSLNFTTSSGPTDSALIYADPNSWYVNAYTDDGNQFSFDFWINPRYTNDTSTSAFTAGTIFHRSSSYALSLISGSSRDVNGFVNGYRLLLQLSHSAEIPPSQAVFGLAPNELIFSSSDNSLSRNTWHHVTVRYPGRQYNNGSGSFMVDGAQAGTFVIGTSLPDYYPANCLIIGNFFEGSKITDFFTGTVSVRDGLANLAGAVDETAEQPASYTMRHGLNAEVHELKMYRDYISDTEVSALQKNGPLYQAIGGFTPSFYLPPFYTMESPQRQYVTDHGGVLATPFLTRANATTTSPVNTDVSFGCGGHYLNLENFVRDFATGTYARLFHLTASVLATSASTPTTFNGYAYADPSNVKRNLTILPNDNGGFLPNFNLMIFPLNYLISVSVTQSYANPRFVNPAQFTDDLGVLTPGFVSLRNLVPSNSFYPTTTGGEDLLFSPYVNPNRTNGLAGAIDAGGRYNVVVQETGDTSSNQVVLFDISNLYYGMQINPGSLVLTDSSITGSVGKIPMTLFDNGEGNIYRANSASGSVYPTWASVGNVFYNEGIILLKHPSLYFFGVDQFQISFSGKQNLHTLTYNLQKLPLMSFSSSNPNYLPVSASFDANENDPRFAYISGINIHDQNMNIVMKSVLAQPIVARTTDKFMFKSSIVF